jgi:hypothetical protein
MNEAMPPLEPPRVVELTGSYDRVVAERLLQLLDERDADLDVAWSNIATLNSECNKLKKECEARKERKTSASDIGWLHREKARLEQSRDAHKLRAVELEVQRNEAARNRDEGRRVAQEIRDCTLENAKLAELEANHPWLLEEVK